MRSWPQDAHPLLVGIDVHGIPPGRREPFHLHHDLIFAFRALSASVQPHRGSSQGPVVRKRALAALRFALQHPVRRPPRSRNLSLKLGGTPADYPFRTTHVVVLCQGGPTGVMRRFISLIAFIIFTTSLGAQTLTSIKIGTTVSGIAGNNPIFVVDGTSYISTQVFVWPVGSKHIVQFSFFAGWQRRHASLQSANFDNVRYAFTGWTASNNLLTPTGSAILTVTGDPTLTSLIAGVTTTYRLHIAFPDGGVNPINANCTARPARPALNGPFEGIVYVNGICYGNSTPPLRIPSWLLD